MFPMEKCHLFGMRGGQLDLITLLVGFDLQRLVPHIAMIFNAKFNLLGVAVVT